jgi:hypothetical protein
MAKYRKKTVLPQSQVPVPKRIGKIKKMPSHPCRGCVYAEGKQSLGRPKKIQTPHLIALENHLKIMHEHIQYVEHLMDDLMPKWRTAKHAEALLKLEEEANALFG